tara:strand:- start:2751 stop:5069 length:2319 start_codon:yes stop_codon:yes gene_type:complete
MDKHDIHQREIPLFERFNQENKKHNASFSGTVVVDRESSRMIDGAVLDFSKTRGTNPSELNIGTVGCQGTLKNVQQRQKVFKNLRDGQYDLIFILGDNLYHHGITKPDDEALTTMLEELKGCNCPVFVILGNHDYAVHPFKSKVGYGTESGGFFNSSTTKAIHQVDRTYHPCNFKQDLIWLMPRRYYVVKTVTTIFYCIDSTAFFVDEVQQIWFAKANKKLRDEFPSHQHVVISHHPLKMYDKRVGHADVSQVRGLRASITTPLLSDVAAIADDSEPEEDHEIEDKVSVTSNQTSSWATMQNINATTKIDNISRLLTAWVQANNIEVNMWWCAHQHSTVMSYLPNGQLQIIAGGGGGTPKAVKAVAPHELIFSQGGKLAEHPFGHVGVMFKPGLQVKLRFVSSGRDVVLINKEISVKRVGFKSEVSLTNLISLEHSGENRVARKGVPNVGITDSVVVTVVGAGENLTIIDDGLELERFRGDTTSLSGDVTPFDGDRFTSTATTSLLAMPNQSHVNIFAGTKAISPRRFITKTTLFILILILVIIVVIVVCLMMLLPRNHPAQPPVTTTMLAPLTTAMDTVKTMLVSTTPSANLTSAIQTVTAGFSDLTSAVTTGTTDALSTLSTAATEVATSAYETIVATSDTLASATASAYETAAATLMPAATTEGMPMTSYAPLQPTGAPTPQVICPTGWPVDATQVCMQQSLSLLKQKLLGFIQTYDNWSVSQFLADCGRSVPLDLLRACESVLPGIGPILNAPGQNTLQDIVNILADI